MKKTLLYLILTLAALAIVFTALFLMNRKAIKKEEVIATAEIARYNPPRLYGLNLDSFDMEEGRIKKNTSFGNLLYDLKLDNTIIGRIIEKMKPVFDFRKIRSGNRYTLFYSMDSLRVLKYLVYEHSPTDYLLISLNDSITIAWKQKPTRSVEKEVSGVIRSSLWNTIYDKKASPLLAITLSDIYAWTIDFFGLQAQDSFRIIYDEIMVDTQVMSIGEVKAACFYHQGKSYYAIPFEQDERLSYFDENGNSLRKEFLKAPLHYSRISSRFSNARMHPLLRIVRPHHGVDYAAPVGTPVLAVADGRISSLSHDAGDGNMVKIRHNSVYATAYLHLMRFANGMQNGSEVKQGEVIGYVGNTGLSTGPHLDFRLYRNGSAIDPLKFDAPPVEPIQDSLKSSFDSVRNVCLERLSKVN